MPTSPGKVIFTSPSKHTGSCQCVLAQLSTPGKQAGTKPELQGSRKEKCSERNRSPENIQGSFLSLAESSLCQGRQPQLRGEALLQVQESKCKMQIRIREVWAGAWEFCILEAAGLHTTPELARLWETSQPSLRTPAALTPASLIISFKLTHSWKKEKQTIKTLILPHLWVSFFQHIMSHCDNYATSSCSTYLQPKKQRPSINTCYIISTHWLLSHSLLVYLSVFPIWLSILWKQPLPCGATWRLTRKEHSVLSADSAQGLHT